MLTRYERLKQFKEKVVPALEIFLVTCIEFNTNSFRLTSEDGDKADYFPMKYRLFKHDGQEWYTVSEDDVLNVILFCLKLKYQD